MSDLPKASEFIGEEGVQIAVNTLREIASDLGDPEVRLRAAEALLNWGARPWYSDAPNPEPVPEA